MTYRDDLNRKTSYELYCMVSAFVREGGELSPPDEELMAAEAESHYEDESRKEDLVDLVDRLHDDDLL